MIFYYWQEHLDEFLKSMQEQGFCPIVVAAHKRFAMSLADQAQDNCWQNYEDVRNYYRSLPDMKDKTRWFKLSIINKLEAFHIFGEKPVHRIVKDHKQVKTGNPVVLPLSTVVGNAIYDYCVNERPRVESRYLFLCDLSPYNKLGKGGIEWAVSKVMAVAGIRQEKGDRKGSHIFRHRAASTMAACNIPSPVISATLGHSSPKSLDAYLYADMDHIRECSLSLAKFPMSKEVISLG